MKHRRKAGATPSGQRSSRKEGHEPVMLWLLSEETEAVHKFLNVAARDSKKAEILSLGGKRWIFSLWITEEVKITGKGDTPQEAYRAFRKTLDRVSSAAGRS